MLGTGGAAGGMDWFLSDIGDLLGLNALGTKLVHPKRSPTIITDPCSVRISPQNRLSWSDPLPPASLDVRMQSRFYAGG